MVLLGGEDQQEKNQEKDLSRSAKYRAHVKQIFSIFDYEKSEGDQSLC